MPVPVAVTTLLAPAPSTVVAPVPVFVVLTLPVGSLTVVAPIPVVTMVPLGSRALTMTLPLPVFTTSTLPVGAGIEVSKLLCVVITVAPVPELVVTVPLTTSRVLKLAASLPELSCTALLAGLV